MSRALLTSVSQVKTYRQCPRLWWFEKVRKFPKAQPIYGMTFGSILHGVIERYLGSDPSGRGPDGEVVDLYPWGWEWHEGYRLEKGDGEKIKSMLREAVADGIIRRDPHLEVEKFFLKGVNEDPLIVMQGYIDVAMCCEVQDHKGIKVPRYALSPSDLKKDVQMLTYAKVILDEQPHPGNMPVTLAHNQFYRKTGHVKTESVAVSPREIKENWKEVQDTCLEMADLAEAGYADCEWKRVETGPISSCRAYGGCKLKSICHEGESPSKFRARRLRLANPKIEGEEAMNLDDKIKARKSYSTKARKSHSTEAKTLAPVGTEEDPFTDDSPDDLLKEIAATKKKATKKKVTKKKVEPSRSAVGPTIYVSCLPFGAPSVIPFHEVFRDVVKKVGGNSLGEYYAKDCWKRRDALQGLAEEGAALYQGASIYVEGLSPDEAALLGHMQPYVGLTVRATR